MTSVRSPSASRRGSSGSGSGNGTARPRSGTGSASGAAASRPFSSTNLSATVASSRFKTFAVQYEILCKNAILCELAKEVPWKNLLDLFTLKFHAVGDVLWRHGDHPSELAFVLCGGFLIRHMKQDQVNEQLSSNGSSSNHTSFQYGDKPAVERTETIVAEKLLKPGASIAVYAVDQNVPMRYNVVTAKFKSISIALPLGKFKSVLRQLTPSTKATLQQLILENETKLCGSIRLAPPQCPLQQRARRATTAPSGLLSSSSTASHSRQSHHSPLKKAVSTPVIASTVSWDSLQVTQPVEYEVNSSLLILHDSALKNKLHIPTNTTTSHSSSSSSNSTKLLRSVSSSSLARTIAKKHTTRRLQSIKLPATIDAFSPQPHADKYRNIEAEALAASAAAALHSIDVVPKIRIGRLLAPIDKPAIVDSTTTELDIEIERPRRASHTPSTSSHQSLAGRHILLADRGKKYREEF